MVSRNLIPTGKPQIASFLFKKHEVILHHTWNTMGMLATGSHSFEVNNLFVPVDRCFIINAKQATLPHLIYQYPFLQLAETTLAVNLSGMAVRFIELCEILLKEKSGEESIISSNASQLNQAEQQLNEARQLFYSIVDLSWEALLSNKKIPINILEQISEASHRLVKVARQSVNELYPLSGLRAADTSTEINRVWRNIHTAGQHALFYR